MVIRSGFLSIARLFCDVKLVHLFANTNKIYWYFLTVYSGAVLFYQCEIHRTARQPYRTVRNQRVSKPCFMRVPVMSLAEFTPFIYAEQMTAEEMERILKGNDKYIGRV